MTNVHFYTPGHSILVLTPSYLVLIDALPVPATPVQPPSYKSVAGIAMLDLVILGKYETNPYLVGL